MFSKKKKYKCTRCNKIHTSNIDAQRCCHSQILESDNDIDWMVFDVSMLNEGSYDSATSYEVTSSYDSSSSCDSNSSYDSSSSD